MTRANQAGRGYQFRVAVFGSRNNAKDTSALADARFLGTALARSGYAVVNGGSSTGLMGVVSKAAHGAGGVVHGVGLAKYDPRPHRWLTDYEAYSFHYERQKRLIELGDIYVALPGAIGTFHEVLEIHILNILGEIKKPLVLVGDYFSKYRDLLNHFGQAGLMHADRSEVFYAKNARTAVDYVRRYFGRLKKRNYHSPIYYPALKPAQIFDHVMQNGNRYEVLFDGLVMTVFPGVYPSNRFRSSRLFAKVARPQCRGKRVADIACGHGTMGLVALDAGAKHVVQVDINPEAVKNARFNARKLSWSRSKLVVHEGDLFKAIPGDYRGKFDVILFNPPFHRESATAEHKLMRAFLTQGKGNGVLDGFFAQAGQFLAPRGKVIFGFSNKDPLMLDHALRLSKDWGFHSKLIAWENRQTIADNRVYEMTLSKRHRVTDRRMASG